MKKLMVSTIIILPLILLAIMLVSGAILALVTHIYVEAVEFVGNGTLVLVMPDEELPPQQQVEVNVLPLKAGNRGLHFASEDESIVTISDDGVVTAKYYGETYITVTSAENKAATAKRKVRVTDTSVHKIEMNSYEADLYEGHPQQLFVTVYPKEAENKSVTWTSSNEDILHVSDNGTVTLMSAGTATVTAVSNDNEEAKATATFTCHKQLNDLETDLTPVITSGRSVKFPKPTPDPVDADVTYSYKSSDPTIAIVDDEGNITFLKEGKVAITVTVTDFGGKTIEKVKEFTSTDGYYIPPLFEKKEYTFDFDEYFKDGEAIEALPIPFASSLEGSYQEFKSVEYSVADVLRFDEDTKQFYFAKEMPVGERTVEVKVRARVYKTGEGAIVDYEDSFVLTVLRNTQSIAVNYGEKDASRILIDTQRFLFDKDGPNTSNAAYVAKVPANSTNTISYSLKEGEEYLQSFDTATGTIMFKKDGGTATVIIYAKDDNGNIKAQREVTVVYVPIKAKEELGQGELPQQKVEVKEPEEGQSASEVKQDPIVLEMTTTTQPGTSGETEQKEEAVLYFNEPVGSTVEYAVVDEKGEETEDAAVVLENRGGVQYIVPQKGGFATVVITVRSNSTPPRAHARRAAPAAEGETVYTFHIYVDRPVSAEDFTIELGSETFSAATIDKFFCTALDSVGFNFTVAGEEGAMEGKKLYASFGTTLNFGSDDISSYASDIAFAKDSASLTVTFGVNYTDRAKELLGEAVSELEKLTLTLYRSAEDVIFSYGAAENVGRISTSQNQLTFTTQGSTDAAHIRVALSPETCDKAGTTLRYSVVKGDKFASITDGTLTFTQEGKVTVKVEAVGRDGKVAAEKQIEISYMPYSGTSKPVTLDEEHQTIDLLLSKPTSGTANTGVIYFTAVAGEEVSFAFDKQGVVTVENAENGSPVITPQKGGFVTLTATVGEKQYTVNVYVDVPVTANDLKILLDGKETTHVGNEDLVCTTSESVPFALTFTGNEDVMQGKRLVLRYASTNETGDKNAIELKDKNIAFGKEAGSLTVTIGVEYTEDAAKFGKSGTVTRDVTLYRAPENVSFAYRGTTTSKINTSRQTLSLTTSTATTGNNYINVSVGPASALGICTVNYSIKTGGEFAAIDKGQITFKSTGEITVEAIFTAKDGTMSAKGEIAIAYAPRSEQVKDVDLDNNDNVDLLLFMTSDTNFDTAIISFTEPDGREVTYRSNDDAIATIDEKNGSWVITPKKGGFTEITVTVAAGEGDAEKTYTINVFVDRAVQNTDFQIDLDSADTLGTTKTSIPFSVTVKNEKGQMAGKKIVVTYSGKQQFVGTDDEASLTDKSITFNSTDASLEVIFSLQYTERGTSFHTGDEDGSDGLSTTFRTLQRNAESITVTYGGVNTVNFSTDESELVIGRDIKVTVQPVHTDVVSYSLENENGVATLDSSTNTIQFSKAGTVTLNIQMTRDGRPTALEAKKVTISYEPTKEGDTAVDLIGDTSIVLTPGQKAHLYFIEPEDAEVTYTLTKGDCVTFEKGASGVYTVTAKKGGFATVTVEAGAKSYTLGIFVNAPVKNSDLSVDFGEKVDANFGTVETQIPFTVSVDNTDGKMEGKKFYVRIGSGEKQYSEVGVTSYEGTIEFDESHGTLNVEFGVEYDADSIEGYSVTQFTASVSKTLQRNTKSITFTHNSIVTDRFVTNENTVDIAKLTTFAPGTHTDKVSYSVVEGSATITNEGKLTFTASGTVTVKVTMLRGGVETLSKTLTVSYDDTTRNFIDADKEAQKNLLFKSDTSTIAAFLFTVPEGGKEPSCVIDVGSDVVSLDPQNGTWHIIPQKAGFATVTLSVGEKTCTVSIYVDAPVSEEDFTIEFKTNNKILEHSTEGEFIFHTCFDKVSYTVTIADKNGSMIGKKLYVTFDNERLTAGEDGVLTLSGKDVKLTGTNYHKFIFGVEYSEEAEAIVGERGDGIVAVNRQILSSQGKLLSKPTITYHLGAAGDKNVENFTLSPDKPTNFVFPELGSIYSLGIYDFKVSARTGEVDPIDLQDKYMSFSLNSSITLIGNDVLTKNANAALKPLQIQLTAKKYCTNEKMFIDIFGQSFELNVTVVAFAQTIEVKTEVGNNLKTLNQGERYKTMLDSIDFTITLGRLDSVTIANKNIQWSLNSTDWKTLESETGKASVTVDNIGNFAGNSIYFRSADGAVVTHFGLEKVNVDDVDFDYNLFVEDSGGRNVFATIGPEKIGTGVPLSYVVPGEMRGTITFQIALLEQDNFLGGFGTKEEFMENAKGEVKDPQDSSWNVSYESYSDSAQIIFKSDNTSQFTMTCEVTYLGKAVKVTFTHYNLTIEFPGFDGENTSDIYKGYQQVRVFAKHSYYNSVDGLVDYFKLPIRATDSIGGTKDIPAESLIWTFTGYKGNSPIDFKLSQSGTQVVYGGETYTIVKNPIEGKPSTLKLVKDDGTETIIAQGGHYEADQKKVPWVDVYAESGYAYLYFGEFQGLSETDIQNDYFGNFGNRPDYTMPSATPNDGSGRDFAISEGSFNFLRIDAGFGESYQDQSKRACFFNFNVLADDTLVNVFDAAGYYANSNIVLHTNLYGVGELGTDGAKFEEATQKGLFLTTSNLGKNTIYGNGYQVNFEARNAELVKVGDKGTSQGVDVQKAYNATIKASNPTETVKKYEHVVVMTMQYAYYCDVEYYSKMSPWGASPSASGYVYLKNTVLRCSAQSALQLYYQSSTAYLENVVLNECIGGFTSDSKDGRYDVVYNFKGYVDVLNYMSFSGLANSINQQIGMLAELGFDAQIKSNEQYLEWFGKTPNEITSASGGSEPWLTSRFFNVFLYNRFKPEHSSTVTTKFWDQTKKQYLTEGEGGKFDNGVGLVTPVDQEANIPGMGKEYYRVFVYNTSAALDGGQKINDSQYYNDRNMSDLFSDSRYIRLLCQYKTLDSDGKTPVKNFDHILWHTQRVYRDYSIIGEREDHIENLKNSLKGVKWPDGTTYEQALAASPVATFARMLSETALPGKDD